MKMIDIAIVIHEANRAFCRTHGDDTIPRWVAAPDWQQASVLAGVRFHAENPDADPSDSHESWRAHKEADGWTYGPEKRPERKQHPCMVPFDELPAHQQAKDHLFRAVCHALLPFCEDAPAMSVPFGLPAGLMPDAMISADEYDPLDHMRMAKKVYDTDRGDAGPCYLLIGPTGRVFSSSSLDGIVKYGSLVDASEVEEAEHVGDGAVMMRAADGQDLRGAPEAAAAAVAGVTGLTPEQLAASASIMGLSETSAAVDESSAAGADGEGSEA